MNTSCNSGLMIIIMDTLKLFLVPVFKNKSPLPQKKGKQQTWRHFLLARLIASIQNPSAGGSGTSEYWIVQFPLSFCITVLKATSVLICHACKHLKFDFFSLLCSICKHHYEKVHDRILKLSEHRALDQSHENCFSCTFAYNQNKSFTSIFQGDAELLEIETYP